MTADQILLDRFGALVDTPERVESLRRFILDLAVRGKLVEQDPADEPAEALLRRIAVEKARRYEAGEIRKPRTLPPIAEDEQLFDLPEGWRWARFGLVAEIASNLEDPKRSPDLPHVAPNHIEKDSGRLLPYGTIGEDGVTSNKHRFFPGQILYSKIRPNLNKAVVIDFEGLCSADMYPLDSYLDTAYLHRFILSDPFVEQVVSDDNRLAMPKVNQTQLQSVAVAVPPLAEQRRIVARVDELMALCDRLAARLTRRDDLHRTWTASTVRHVSAGEAIDGAPAWSFAEAHLDALLTEPDAVPLVRRMVLDLAVRGQLTRRHPDDEPAEALLQRIATEKARRYETGEIRKPKTLPPVAEGEQPFDLPEGWTWTRANDLLDEVTSGSRGWAKYYCDRHDGPSFIRIGNLHRDRLDLKLEDVQLLDLPGEVEGARSRLQAGDILISITADLGSIGVVPEGFGEGYINQHIALARPSDLSIAGYLAMYLLSPPGQDTILENQRGGTKTGLGLDDIRSARVPFPPLAEQRRIVTRVDALLALCDRLSSELARSHESGEALLRTVLAEAI